MRDPIKEERLLDLLSDQALFELSPGDKKELDDLLEIYPEWKGDESFSLTAAAISLSGLDSQEEMPASLRDKILAGSTEYFEQETEKVESRPVLASSNVIEFAPRRSNWNWLGWAAAAAACVALAVNIWFTRMPERDVIVDVPPVNTPPMTMAERRQQMMDTSADMVKANWAAGGMADMKDVSGDIVWSDAKQQGYMRLKGLPANDGTKETYQLWIFDETQDQKTPIDGGVFNVNANGEVIIPINPKLKTRNPSMFAITVEKPGGVVVSERKKMAALAKVQV